MRALQVFVEGQILVQAPYRQEHWCRELESVGVLRGISRDQEDVIA
jgi:hypothetical protein